MVESTREIGDKIETETRFYITSLVWLACLLGSMVRDYWAIENSLHWVLDMVFRDDACWVRTDRAPANFTTIKHMALNLIRRPSCKAAAWNDDYLASVIVA
jgi:predicted transposase YbfD/YdcC